MILGLLHSKRYKTLELFGYAQHYLRDLNAGATSSNPLPTHPHQYPIYSLLHKCTLTPIHKQLLLHLIIYQDTSL
jgi:hypothetical protein